MDDRLKESLSAMMDDEADELAVRRVLAQGESEEVQAQWRRWQRLREELGNHEPHWGEVDIRAGFWARLDPNAETDADSSSAVADTPKRMPGRRVAGGSGRLGMVALLLVTLGVGFGAGQRWAGEEPGAQLAKAGTGTQQPLVAAEEVPSVPLDKLDQAQWEQLSNYMLRHAQHNSVAAGHGAVGFARVASVSPGSP